MSRIKMIGIAVLALLVLIVVLQNRGVVKTEILFFTLEAPHAVLLFGTVIVGYILGLMTANKVLRKASSNKQDA